MDKDEHCSDVRVIELVVTMHVNDYVFTKVVTTLWLKESTDASRTSRG